LIGMLRRTHMLTFTLRLVEGHRPNFAPNVCTGKRTADKQSKVK
jgi:hypothetical protein